MGRLERNERYVNNQTQTEKAAAGWTRKLQLCWQEKRGRTVLVGLLALCYLVLLLLSCCPGIFRQVAAVAYPQQEITGEEFYETSPVVVGVTMENGVFTTTESGWIYLHYDTFGVVRPRSVSVTYTALSQDSLTTTWYFVDSYQRQTVTLTQGLNEVMLKGGSANDAGLRLDMPEGITYQLEKLVVNDSDFLAHSWCSTCRRALALVTMALAMTGALWLGTRVSTAAVEKRKQLTAKRDALLEGEDKKALRWLLRHFAVVHNADVATLSWVIVSLAQYALCRAGLGLAAWALLLVPIFALGLRMGAGEKRQRRVGRSVCFGLCFVVLGGQLILWLKNFASLQEMLATRDPSLGLAQFWAVALIGMMAQALVLAVHPGTREDLEEHSAALLRVMSFTLLLYPILETAIKTMIQGYSLAEAVRYFRVDLFAPLLGVNLAFACLVMLALLALLGPHLASVLGGAAYLVLLLGNGIKILYQDTMFKPIDFMVIGDLFRVMPNYIGTVGVVALCILVLVALGLVIWQIKRVGRFLRPRMSLLLLVLAIPALVFLCTQLTGDDYDDVLYGKVAWLPETVYWRVNGSMVYNYYNCIDFMEVFPSKPDGYSASTMDALEQEFDQYATNSTFDVEPDVVLIMAESLFDVSQLEGVTYSIDPTATIRQYQVGNIVSSRYGGGTAGVEFEGITGFSNVFFLDDLIAYTTYMNNPSERIPSIASAFNDAGYQTTAIHLNDRGFYNRDIAYQVLGFDQFLSISDFTFNKEDYNADGYVRDEHFFAAIEAQLDSSDESQFVFGVSIECHNPYDAKFTETELKVTSDLLDEAATSQLEQYAQAVLDFDQALASFIDYLSQRERPTVLYIWGDHLPNLMATSATGYLSSNTYAKYITPFVAYSNYGTITVDTEYMTPNQITPQILMDTGIPHSSFYDYIYSLRETDPVLHHSYTSDLTTEGLQKYWLIQYDLMFGNQYLADDN
jgi:phosphoglycerol transferase MdoB-like AlkP superfamily enzyme